MSLGRISILLRKERCNLGSVQRSRAKEAKDCDFLAHAHLQREDDMHRKKDQA